MITDEQLRRIEEIAASYPGTEAEQRAIVRTMIEIDRINGGTDPNRRRTGDEIAMLLAALGHDLTAVAAINWQWCDDPDCVLFELDYIDGNRASGRAWLDDYDRCKRIEFKK
jgi:hypothetical protein